MKRRFVSILCAATMVASLMTGATVVSAADKDVKDISIGVSFGQNVHPFFVAMQKGIEQACTDLGVENCNILAADSSLETQVSQIENLVTKGSDVLLLNPYDSDGVVNAVEAATEKGVGVFTMDVDCEGSTSFVASDNKKVGEMLADAVIEQLDGKGKIAIIDGITVTSLKDRTDGFMNKIKDTDIEVVAEQQTAHAPPATTPASSVYEKPFCHVICLLLYSIKKYLRFSVEILTNSFVRKNAHFLENVMSLY